MADARKDKRTLLSLKIRYKSATLEDFIERYSMDISGGGVFIKAKKPLAVGTLLKFEFMLQDQSTLIHGVGRVAWRREESEADANNPAGMGIKFIKMDPESRSIVQRIVEERVSPGVFERGKEGVSFRPGEPSEPPEDGAAKTKVRHVSEFLASALEEGGAGETAMREARAGAERAREVSIRGTAIGAFSRRGEPTGPRPTISDAPSRGAASAFGTSSATAGVGLRSSAAPAMDEYDDDDFVDNETTKVQHLPTTDFPSSDADATVIASETPFLDQRRQTPVVPSQSERASPLENAVPDLFGPDSFGPAPGEVIDASLLDPGVATVPPKASALPRSAMPDPAGITPKAFTVPQAPKPAGAQPSFAQQERKSRVGLIVALLVVLLAGGGVAAWQLGLLDGSLDKALGTLTSTFGAPKKTPVVKAPPPVTNKSEPSPPAAAENEREVVNTAEVADEAQDAAEAEAQEDSSSEASNTDLVKLRITSVPNGAFVTVDGKRAGRTPLELERDSGAKLSVYAKARGFLGRRQQVTVDQGETEVRLVLSPLPYEIEVVTDPPGARASAVGGGEVSTPGTLEFSSMPTSRKLVISKDGFVTVTKLVTRRSFTEERSRMVASVNVTLTEEGGSEPVATTATEAPDNPLEAAEPAPVEQSAPSEPTDGGDVP